MIPPACRDCDQHGEPPDDSREQESSINVRLAHKLKLLFTQVQLVQGPRVSMDVHPVELKPAMPKSAFS
jgi:hypothetical protein